MAKVKIVMTGPRTGTVLVDGVKMPSVVAVNFSVSLLDNSPAMVEIVLRPYGEIEIEGEMDASTSIRPGSNPPAPNGPKPLPPPNPPR